MMGQAMRAEEAQIVPPPAKRGLSREESAAYIGVSPSLFDQMVKDGRMPRAKRINSRVVWDRLRLDSAFAALPDGEEEGGKNPFDDIEL